MSDNITLPREVAEGALEALEYAKRVYGGYSKEAKALRAALAAEQPKPEPVGVMQESCIMEGLVIPVVTQELPVGTPLYAALVEAEKDKEIAALKDERRRNMAEIYSLCREIDALQAENERLREALKALLSLPIDSCPYDAATARACARAALRGEDVIWAARNDPRE